MWVPKSSRAGSGKAVCATEPAKTSVKLQNSFDVLQDGASHNDDDDVKASSFHRQEGEF
jgi:hypothetical protein